MLINHFHFSNINVRYGSYEVIVREHGETHVPYYHFFIGLLMTLEVLHVFWTYLIWKVIEKAILSKSVEDSRSDSDSDEDASEKAKAKKE